MQQTPIQQAIKDYQRYFNEKYPCTDESNDGTNMPLEDRVKWRMYNFLLSLTDIQQQYIETFLQQHAEGFAEWMLKKSYYPIPTTHKWYRIFGKVPLPEFTTSELYTKYIEYINSLK